MRCSIENKQTASSPCIVDRLPFPVRQEVLQNIFLLCVFSSVCNTILSVKEIKFTCQRYKKRK